MYWFKSLISFLCVQAEVPPVAVPEVEAVPAEPVPDTMAEDFVVTESAVAVEAAMSEPAVIEEPVSHTVSYFNVGYVASVCAHALFSDTMFFQLYLGSCEHN